MIDLNLLSPERQKSLYGRVLFAMIERLMITLIVLVLASTIVLLGIENQLTTRLSDIEARQVLSTEYVSINQEIERLNAAIDSVENTQKEAVPTTVLIDDLIRRTPGGILVSSMMFETDTDSMRIIGFAERREQLLDYEAQLIDSPYLSRVESPISNLFKRTDLEFQFEGLIDKERLRAAVEPRNDAEED